MGIFWVESPPKHASVGLAEQIKYTIHVGQDLYECIMSIVAPYEQCQNCLLLVQAPFLILSMISFSQWQYKFLPT